jgi:regulator of sigma E protease
MLQVLSFIVLVGSVVFIHELGHYLAARFCGVGVLKFSLGFGPSIWKREINGTEYKVCLLPLGGYVRMVGDLPDLITGKQATDDEVRQEENIVDKKTSEFEGEELSEASKLMIADKNKWFIYKKYWQRSLIVFAGPLFNFIMAYFVIFFLAIFIGLPYPDGTKLGGVMKGSPAEAGGLMAGDEILKINGTLTKSISEIQKIINTSEGKEILVEIKRSEDIKSLSVIPQKKSFKVPGHDIPETYMIGISAVSFDKPVPVKEAFVFSGLWIYSSIKATVYGLVGLVKGEVSMDAVGGPVMMFHVTGAVAEEGIGQFLKFLATVNIILGIMNLLPIPVLDGGHLLIFTLEAIFGSFSIKKKEIVQAFGFMLLISLMVVAFKNDILRDNSKMLSKESSWNEE